MKKIVLQLYLNKTLHWAEMCKISCSKIFKKLPDQVKSRQFLTKNNNKIKDYDEQLSTSDSKIIYRLGF